MTDAAVGFQCPSCVAEGRKQTRAGRTPYGGVRSANPGLTTMVLIGVNVAVWIAVLAAGGSSSYLVDLLGLRPNGVCIGGGLVFDVSHQRCDAEAGTWLPGVVDGAYWQLVTSMFLHVQLWHIGGNMLALYMLGPQIETVMGRTRFLALYFLSGLAGSATVYWLSAEVGTTLGASGAIFGLFGALVVIVHKIGGDLRSVAGLVLINIVITVAVPNISWQGHLGGFLGGAVIAAALVYAPRTRRTQVQVGLLVAIGASIALAVIARSAALA
jgi:membrane associated rhomboid family serine protease